MIDGAFKNNNRTFFQSFIAGENDLRRNSFVKYYMPLVESKDFNALIDNKPFFRSIPKN